MANQVTQSNELQIITNDGVEHQCKLVLLDNSHFDQLYELEKMAAEELAGNYILKSKTFVQRCLDGGFCCGLESDGMLVAFLMLDLLQGTDHGYGEVLHYQFKEDEKFLFRDGAYVLPSFRRRGVAKSLGRFLTSHPDYYNIHSIYTAISPINFPNLNNFTQRDYVLRKFYQTISGGGRLRYLIQYYPYQSFEEGAVIKVSSNDYDRQKELFAQGFVGVEFVSKDSDTFILFKKPTDNHWYKRKFNFASTLMES